MTHLECQRELTKLIYQKYGSLLLTREQVSEVLSISTATLARMANSAIGVQYQKNGKAGKNGRVRYPIDAVVDYILSNHIQTV